MKDGKRLNASTGLRHNDRNDTAKARQVRARLEAAELEKTAQKPSQQWEAWVIPFLERRCKSPKTLLRYLNAWKWLAFWLQLRRITGAGEIRYQHAIDYMTWRTSYRKKSGKISGRNTALFELKLFGLIMSEAVKFGLANGNPINRLGIAKEKVKAKPEFTDEDITEIRVALAVEPSWMQISFEIALQTGCRLRETIIPMTLIDFKRSSITFGTPKGGESRAFTVPMPDSLRNILRSIKTDVTLEMPFQPSRAWGQFFARIGKSQFCFHCLRVTYVTRLARQGVPLSAAMRLVNHGDALVHRVYQRMGVEDVRQYANLVQFPACTDAKPSTQRK